jgi:ABC-type transport system substrate-binding protein
LKRRLSIALGLMVVMILVAVGGCSSSSTTESGSQSETTTTSSAATEVKYGGTLRIVGTAMEPNIGWPATMMGGGPSDAQYMLETLLRGDEQGEAQPWLAESYEVADDHTSITFTIRKDVKFHDGSDLTAEVVQWNLQNYITAKKQPLWESVDVIDDYTVRVNLSSWSVTALSSFADMDSTNVAFIVSKSAYDLHDQAWMEANPVGTGPFKFKSFSLDSSLIMVKNETYWAKDDQGRQLPYLDEIDRLVASDSFAQSAMMETDEADMVRVETGQAAKEMADQGLNVSYVLDSTYYLIGDTANKESPWANQTVREAIEYAIDKESLAAGFGYGYTQAPYQIAPRYTTLYEETETASRKYDVAKAKELLAEAGYPSGFETEIICFPTASKEVITAVQEQLKQVGITVEITFTDIAKWVSLTGPGNWPENAALFTVLPAGDTNFVGGLQYLNNTIGQGWERTAAWKQAYDAAMNSDTVDQTLLRAVTKIMEDDASIIPVVESGTAHVTQDYVVKDFNSRGSVPFWNSEEAWLNK